MRGNDRGVGNQALGREGQTLTTVGAEERRVDTDRANRVRAEGEALTQLRRAREDQPLLSRQGAS